jgi:hypothetical protein
MDSIWANIRSFDGPSMNAAGDPPLTRNNSLYLDEVPSPLGIAPLDSSSFKFNNIGQDKVSRVYYYYYFFLNLEVA